MKKLLLMGAMVGGLSMSGLSSTAKADDCYTGGSYGRSYGSYVGLSILIPDPSLLSWCCNKLSATPSEA